MYLSRAILYNILICAGSLLFSVTALGASTTSFAKRYDEIREFIDSDKCKPEYEQSLKSLVGKEFTLTQDCFEKLEDDTVTPLVIDLFEGKNLAVAIKKVIEFYLNPENTTDNEGKNTPFIFGHFGIVDDIRNNDELKNKLSSILEELNKTHEIVDGYENYFEKLITIRPFLLDAHDLIVKDANIKADGGLAKFIKGAIRIINTVEASGMAAEILKTLRSDAESELLSAGVSNDVSVDISSNGVVSLSAGISYSVKKGVGANSLYEISSKIGASAGVKIKVPGDIFSLSGTISAEVAYTSLFFSIEQLLDSGELLAGDQPGHISKALFNELSGSRQRLQDKERELLACFGTDVENFLKMLMVIPFDVNIRWPRITRAEGAMSSVSKTLEAAISAEITSLIELGFEFTSSCTSTIYKKSHPFLSLLNDDCFPANNLNIKDIKKIIGSKYDLSGNFIKDKLIKDKIPVLYQSYIFLGDLRDYVSTLADLAELAQDIKVLVEAKDDYGKKSKISKIGFSYVVDKENGSDTDKKLKAKKALVKELTKRKHKYESSLSPKNLIGSEGRLGVLKACIITAAILRSAAKTEEEISLFRKMFMEIEKLSLLLELSKDKNSRKGSFSHSANQKLRDIGYAGSMTVTIPGIIENVTVSCDYHNVSNSVFLDEDGTSISLTIKIPSYFVDKDITNKLINLCKEKSKNSKIESIKKIFRCMKNSISWFASKYDNLTASELIPFVNIKSLIYRGEIEISTSIAKIPGNSSPESSKPKPIPGRKKFIKTKSKWKRVYSQYSVVLPSTYTIPGKEEIENSLKKIVPIEVTLTKELTQNTQQLGTETLNYIVSRFNVWQMGLSGEEDNVSVTWNSFKSSNKQELSGIIKNIGSSKPGILYELQCIYNDNLGNVNKMTKKDNKIFENLLKCCSTFVQNETDANLNAALDALDEVLKFNYKNNFLVHYNKAFSLKKS